MNAETMVIGTTLIALGVYDTYFDMTCFPIPISEIFLLSGGALLVNQARNDANFPEAMENVAKSMVYVKGT